MIRIHLFLKQKSNTLFFLFFFGCSFGKHDELGRTLPPQCNFEEARTILLGTEIPKLSKLETRPYKWEKGLHVQDPCADVESRSERETMTEKVASIFDVN